MPLKLIGTRADKSSVEFFHEDVGLLADGSAFRSIFTIDGKDHCVDVSRRLVDIHGARRRANEERVTLCEAFGIIDFKIVEDSHAGISRKEAAG